MNTIYCIENTINGKKYVGKTSKDIEKRFREHVNASNRKTTNSLLHKAILKYGAKSFKIYILEENITSENSNSKEIFYIKSLNTLCPNGYNLTKGGDGGEWSNERKRRQSEFQKKFANTPEEKLKRSIRSKKTYEDPKLRLKISNMSKDRKWINKNETNKFVKEFELQTYIENGWILGKFCKNSNKDKITINKDSINKIVYKEELNSYISLGWSVGGKEINKQMYFINNGLIENKIEINEKIPNGWVKGRLTKCVKEGSIRIYKESIEKIISTDELQLYLKNGWTRGRKQMKPFKRNNGKIYITKCCTNKLIFSNELERYLNEGWKRGKYQRKRLR